MAPPKSQNYINKVEKPGQKWQNEAKRRRTNAQHAKLDFMRKIKEKPDRGNLKIITPAYVGARNPYALANVIQKEPITWPRITNKAAHLEKIFAPYAPEAADKPIKYSQLFDPAHGSPLFPKIQKRKSGLLKKAERPEKITATQLLKLNFTLRCGDSQRSWVTDCASQPSLDWDTLEPNTDRINSILDPYVRVDAPIQGCPADCWLISALSSVAWTDSWPIAGIVDYLELYDFLRSDSVVGAPPESTIPLIVDNNNNQIPAFAFSKFSETWPAIFELYMTSLQQKLGVIPQADPPNVAQIGRGDPHYACACITMNEITADSRIMAQGGEFDPDVVWNIIHNNCLQGNASFMSTTHPTVAWTYCTGSDTPDADLTLLGCTAETRAPSAVYSDEILVASHAYSVLGTMTANNNQQFIMLRNPWGGAPDGNGNYFLEVPVNLQNYRLADPCSIYLYPSDNGGNGPSDYLVTSDDGSRKVKDGIFGLHYEDFAKFFAGFAWV
jgi:hypothetical protein